MGEPDPGQEPASAPCGVKRGPRASPCPKDNIEFARSRKPWAVESEVTKKIRYEGYGPQWLSKVIVRGDDEYTATAYRRRPYVLHFTTRTAASGSRQAAAGLMFDRKGERSNLSRQRMAMSDYVNRWPRSKPVPIDVKDRRGMFDLVHGHRPHEVEQRSRSRSSAKSIQHQDGMASRNHHDLRMEPRGDGRS